MLLIFEPSLLLLLLGSISGSPGYPLIHYVAKAILAFLILLTLPPKCWEARDLGDGGLMTLTGLPICHALDTQDFFH